MTTGRARKEIAAWRRLLLDDAESAWTGKWYLRAWKRDGIEP